MNTRGRIIRTGLLLLMGLLFFLLDLLLGSVPIPPSSLPALLTGAPEADEAWGQILLLFRLPRALTALVAGMALSLSGLNMQTLFKNPLAGPSILGVNAGASLAAALFVLASGFSGGLFRFLTVSTLWGRLSLTAASALGGGLFLFLLLLFSRRVSASTLLLVGLLLGYAANSLVTILLQFSSAEKARTYLIWTFGSFGGVTWTELAILIPIIAFFLLLQLFAVKPLNALLLGEHYARSMGVNLTRTRSFLIITAACLSGTVTAFCGPVSFLGIAIPHLARGLVKTADHRILLPATALAGGAAALLADTLTNLPGIAALPLNAVTSLLGVPVIIGILMRQHRVREARE